MPELLVPWRLCGSIRPMSDVRSSSLREFWPKYLREHALPETRRLHYLGTGLAILCLLLLVVTQEIWWLPASVASGYLFAWIGHAFVERNRPATFTHPVWSLLCDFRMFGLWVAGRLDGELKAAGVETQNR